jgi:hypothetical protein
MAMLGKKYGTERPRSSVEVGILFRQGTGASAARAVPAPGLAPALAAIAQANATTIVDIWWISPKSRKNHQWRLALFMT